MLQTNTYSTAGRSFNSKLPFIFYFRFQLIYIWSRIFPSVAPFLCFFKNGIFIDTPTK